MLRKGLMCLPLLFPVAAAAQQGETTSKRVVTYVTEEDERDSKQAEALREKERHLAFREYPVGKTLWYKPSKMEVRYFFQRLKTTPSGASLPDGKITPTSTVSFKVLELVEYWPGSTDYFAYRIEFEDGTPAYLNGSALGGYFSGVAIGADRPSLTDQGAAAASSLNVKLFTRNPDQLAEQYATDKAYLAQLKLDLEADERKRQQELEASERRLATAVARDHKRKGGVRLGMTMKQVRASNWGQPDSVNRTTGAFGVHEQWVYEEGNYLYFEDGVLTTIQN
jgi:hypothetical protein